MNLPSKSIAVTGEFGLLVRRKALDDRQLELREVLRVLGAEKPLDMNEHLISFGPNFGGEALEELSQRLIELGLEYFDDFFEVTLACPNWVQLRAQYFSAD